jgi:anaerobic selenocysteine-containing dehydrogenase
MGEQRISYCRNCAANCGVLLDVEDNRILRVIPDRANPVSEGYVCIKGTLAAELQNGAEDRLTQCMKRGPDGHFQPIDRLQAVEEIAERLRAILAAHGPRALAAFFGTTSYSDCIGKPFLKSLMAALGAPAIFSSMTVDQSSKWVTAGRMGVWANGKPFYTQTDVMLIAGSNALVSHQGYPMVPLPGMNVPGALRDAKKRGVKLILIDPRRTEMARHADLFIQPLPGFDADIFAALIRLVLKAGRHNEAFCARWTVNLDVLAAMVEPFTPERVADRAGITAAELKHAADMLGAAQKAGIGTGTGHNMAAFSNTAEHLAEALTAILGAYILAGDEIPNPGVFMPRPEVETAIGPNRTWELEPKCLSADFGKLMGEFPASIFPEEVVCEGPDRLRAVFVTGANPAMCLGEPERVHRALDALDLLVVFDPRLDSATAQHAHYVIAPTLQFEREEVTTFTEMCFHFPFIQYTKAAAEPPPQVMGEQEFFWRLAQRLGVQLTLKNIPFGLDFDAIPGGLAVDMQTMPAREKLIGWLVEEAGVSFEALKAHPHGLRLNIRKTVAPAEADTGARLDLCPPDVGEEIRAVERRGPLRDADGFLLTVRRHVESFNSSFLGSATTLRRRETNKLHMHPADLLEIGAQEDGAVEIASEHGSVLGYACADATMKPGVVSMAHCWGAGAQADPFALRGSHTGRLVSLTHGVQPINRMPLQSGIPVTVKPLGFTLEQARAKASAV